QLRDAVLVLREEELLEQRLSDLLRRLRRRALRAVHPRADHVPTTEGVVGHGTTTGDVEENLLALGLELVGQPLGFAHDRRGVRARHATVRRDHEDGGAPAALLLRQRVVDVRVRRHRRDRTRDGLRVGGRRRRLRSGLADAGRRDELLRTEHLLQRLRRPDPCLVDALGSTGHGQAFFLTTICSCATSTGPSSTAPPTSGVPSPFWKPARKSSTAAARASSVSDSSLPVSRIVDRTSDLRRRWSSSSDSNRLTSSTATSSSLPFVPAQTTATWSSTAYGVYCGCLSSSVSTAPRCSCARDAASGSDANIATASSQRYCASSSFSVPETFFIVLICASPPTRDTEI